MDEFTDKLILIALAFLLLLEQKETGNSVVALLIAVTAAALGIYIEEKKILYLLFAVVFALSLIEPFLVFFFPVFFYDMARQKMYVMGALFLVLFGLNLPETMERIAAWVLAAVISLLFAYKTEKKQYLSNELIRIRDSGVELNLALKEKNRSLLEKQDYEIHLATLSERNRIARAYGFKADLNDGRTSYGRERGYCARPAFEHERYAESGHGQYSKERA